MGHPVASPARVAGQAGAELESAASGMHLQHRPGERVDHGRRNPGRQLEGPPLLLRRAHRGWWLPLGWPISLKRNGNRKERA